jgi:hypothetical protein
MQKLCMNIAKELKLLYRRTQKGSSTNASTRPYRNRDRMVTASTWEYHLQICQSAKRTFTEIRI